MISSICSDVSVVSQRVGHGLTTEQQQQQKLYAKSMVGPVNKTALALMAVHPITSQIGCSCTSMVFLLVWEFG